MSRSRRHSICIGTVAALGVLDFASDGDGDDEDDGGGDNYSGCGGLGYLL